MIALSSLLLILLSVLESINCENNDSNNGYQIPSISLSNLKTKEDKETLRKALSSTGIIAITGIDEETQDFSKTRNNALEGLCECSNNKDILDIDNSESFTLSDGITTRTSIATLTSINSIPLSLNNNQIDSVCSSSSVSSTNNNLLSQSMEKLRDYVHLVSKEFILALDDIITGAKDGDGDDNDDVLLETSHGKRYNNVNDIIQDATHLEHFHVYSKKSKQHQNSMHDKGEMDNNVLDTHIDAGLFLSFVPSMSCNSDDVSSSFMVHVDGKLQTVKFPSNSIIIMLGIGAEHWLQNIRIGSTSTKLVATKHAVQMNYDSMRSWYGTMYLVPEKAIIDKDSKSTFEDMRSSMIIRHPKHISNNNNSNDNYNINESISIGCGNSHSSNNKLSSASSSLQQSKSVVERRLQTHVDASVCNNSTNFYCWMSCIDVPNTDSAHDGETLYCADATILDEGIDAAVTSCSDIKTGAAGGAMNPNCVGVWYAMEDDVQSQTFDNVDDSVTQPPSASTTADGAVESADDGADESEGAPSADDTVEFVNDAVASVDDESGEPEGATSADDAVEPVDDDIPNSVVVTKGITDMVNGIMDNYFGTLPPTPAPTLKEVDDKDNAIDDVVSSITDVISNIMNP